LRRNIYDLRKAFGNGLKMELIWLWKFDLMGFQKLTKTRPVDKFSFMIDRPAE